MSPRVRWYNRLAAWLYPVICAPIIARLASPAWVAYRRERAINRLIADSQRSS